MLDPQRRYTLPTPVLSLVFVLLAWTSALLPLRPLWVSLSTGMIGSCHLYSYIWPGTRLAYGRGLPRLMLPGN